MRFGDCFQKPLVRLPWTAAAITAPAALAFAAGWSRSGGIALLAALAAAGLLALAGGLLAARRAAGRLRSSIDELTEAARAISPARPDQRFPVRDAADESAGLVRELNGVLQRMEDAVVTHLQFAGNVAHEFRTPVSTLLADVQLRKLGGPDGGDEREFLERAEAELRHLGRLIESLLVMARVEAGERCRDPVHVDDVVRRALRRCADAAGLKAVRLDLDCPETTPSRDPFVAGNADLLQVLVENLIRNAIQHSPDGASVSIRTRRSRGTVQVIVSDEGAGIPSSMAEEVFRRGVRAPGSATLEGSGLGLSIATSVARLHDGRITLGRSETGGCVFSVELPALDSASSE